MFIDDLLSAYRLDPIDEGYWTRLYETSSMRLTHEQHVLRLVRYFAPESEDHKRREIHIANEFKRRKAEYRTRRRAEREPES